MKINYRIFSKKELIAALEELDYNKSAYGINRILSRNWDKKLLEMLNQLDRINEEIEDCLNRQEKSKYLRLANKWNKLSKEYDRLSKLDNKLFYE